MDDVQDPGSNRGEQMRLSFEDDPVGRVEEEEDVTCGCCGKRYSLPRWFASQEIKSRFCSRACRTAWELEREEEFELKLQGRPKYRGGNWGTLSAEARKRDGYSCQICGVSEEELKRQLDVHHKVPFRLFSSAVEANCLTNLISVCRTCHKKAEEIGKDDYPLFKEVKHPGQRPESKNRG